MRCAVKLCFIPVAEALSRTLSDAYRRVISGIRQGQVAGRPTLAGPRYVPMKCASRLAGVQGVFGKRIRDVVGSGTKTLFRVGLGSH
jgi:hypothetical protein